MNPADLPLRDIHLPPAPSWWPPAPGWWLLAAGVVALALACVWFARRHTRTRTRRGALDALAALARDYAATHDAHALAAALSVLLRRLALGALPRERVAGLTGERWIDALDALVPAGRRFDAAARRALAEAPYRGNAACDAEALIAACERWLRALPPDARGGRA
jgi:hypothetical protein